MAQIDKRFRYLRKKTRALLRQKKAKSYRSKAKSRSSDEEEDEDDDEEDEEEEEEQEVPLSLDGGSKATDGVGSGTSGIILVSTSQSLVSPSIDYC